MQLKIRPYTKIDCKDILEIINYNIEKTTNIYEYTPRTIKEQENKFNIILDKKYPIIVAEYNSKLIGFGYFSEFREKKAYQYTVEHSIYISNNFQGKGIGKKILLELINLAKTSKFKTMIGVIDSQNTNSILFHEKNGFKNIGTLKNVGFKFNKWLDVTFMQLDLT